MNDMAQVTVTVSGRSYRMACEDGQEEHLVKLGERFDATIAELKQALGEIGDQRLLVMAGLLMTDRLDETEQRLSAVEGEIAGLRRSGNETLSRHTGLEEGFIESLESAAARIERLAQRLRMQEHEEAVAGGG